MVSKSSLKINLPTLSSSQDDYLCVKNSQGFITVYCTLRGSHFRRNVLPAFAAYLLTMGFISFKYFPERDVFCQVITKCYIHDIQRNIQICCWMFNSRFGLVKINQNHFIIIFSLKIILKLNYPFVLNVQFFPEIFNLTNVLFFGNFVTSWRWPKNNIKLSSYAPPYTIPNLWGHEELISCVYSFMVMVVYYSYMSGYMRWMFPLIARIY